MENNVVVVERRSKVYIEYFQATRPGKRQQLVNRRLRDRAALCKRAKDNGIGGGNLRPRSRCHIQMVPRNVGAKLVCRPAIDYPNIDGAGWTIRSDLHGGRIDAMIPRYFLDCGTAQLVIAHGTDDGRGRAKRLSVDRYVERRAAEILYSSRHDIPENLA
jgi:hypothetical protein